MPQQTTQSTESAIVLAPGASLTTNAESSVELAFRASVPELLALPKDKLLVVNVDVQSAVCLGLAAPERLQVWRDRIIDELPRFDISAFDRLEQYAKALMHAQVEYTLARKSPADIRGLTEATRCRYQVLMNDARALASRGLLSPDKLAAFPAGRRRSDRILALSALIKVLKNAWPRIQGKTALTLSELEQADEQAMQLMFALAHQKKPLKDLAKITELRQRAFTVFANAYTQIRRAIQYLCPDAKEAERILPSLYPRQRSARKAEATPSSAAPTAETSIQSAPRPRTTQFQNAVPWIQTMGTSAAPEAMKLPLATPRPRTDTAGLSEATTAFALGNCEMMNGAAAIAAPKQPTRNGTAPEAAIKRRKSKPRRRPTKRERFLRSLGVATHGIGSPQ